MAFFTKTIHNECVYLLLSVKYFQRLYLKDLFFLRLGNYLIIKTIIFAIILQYLN